jgi:hypothetical protein
MNRVVRAAHAAGPAVAALAVLLAGGCDQDQVEARVVALSALPSELAFPGVPLGVADEGVVVIRNSGNGPWVPVGPPVVTGAAFSWVSGCDEPLGPQRSCELRVRFAPTELGPTEATITVAAPGVGASATDASVVVPVGGRGSPPVLTLSPSRLDFGTLAVDELAVQVVDVVNAGVEPIEFDVVTLGEGFRAAGDDRVQLRLDPGERRAVNVVFQPRRGGPHTATIVAELCGARCGPTIEATGVGAAPRVDAEPRQLDLGQVAVGGTAERTVTLRNVGVGVLVIDGLDLVSPSADLVVTSPELPATLGEGAAISVDVQYTPSMGHAVFESLLVVSSNDALSAEVYIPVIASAAGPGIEILPSAVHFGHLADGASREAVVVVRSIGDVPVADVRIDVDSSLFEILDVPTQADLQPMEAVTFRVRATASDVALQSGGGSGRLLVTGRDVGATSEMTFLAGDGGCLPVPVVGHANLGLVAPRLGAQGVVVLRNEGDAPCQLERFAPGGGGLGYDPDFAAAPEGLRPLAPGDLGAVRFALSSSRLGQHRTTVELGFVGVPASVFVSASATVVDARIGVVPSTVSLGPTAVGCPEPRGLASLVNSGGTAFEVTSVAVEPSSAPFSLSLGALPLHLPPGASHSVDIRGLLPQAAIGEHVASVVFGTNLNTSATLLLRLTVAPAEEPITEVFTVPPVPAVDVLFVVDNSGSMEDDQAQLAANFAAFFEAGLTSEAPMFQVGVTTTDVLSVGSARGRLVGEPAILDGTTPQLADAFAANVRVGIDGFGLELGLEAMRLALLEPENARLFRRDAALSVVFVTDEDDAGAFPADLPDPALAAPLEAYIALLQAFKGGTVANAPVLVSGVVSPGAAYRYEEVVRFFDGSILDIQSPTWGSRLAEIGTATFSLSRTFRLSDAAIASSLVVHVDGVATTAFDYDEERRAVVLRDQPPPGAEVAITYGSGCR